MAQDPSVEVNRAPKAHNEGRWLLWSWFLFIYFDRKSAGERIRPLWRAWFLFFVRLRVVGGVGKFSVRRFNKWAGTKLWRQSSSFHESGSIGRDAWLRVGRNVKLCDHNTTSLLYRFTTMSEKHSRRVFLLCMILSSLFKVDSDRIGSDLSVSPGRAEISICLCADVL